MKLLRNILLLGVLTLALQSCKDTHTSSEREVTIDNEDWIRHYRDRGEDRILIGDSVSLVGEDNSSFIVNIGGDVTINIPKETEYLVRVVDSEGFSNVPQDVKDFDSDKAHIKAAIERRAKMLLTNKAEQDSAHQSTTRSESKSK